MLLSWKFWLLGLFGFAAGGIIAAGIFAFLAVIGVFPRLMGKTRTKKHILLYETLIVLGGAFGNVFDLYEFSIPAGQFFGQALMAVFGVSVGDLCGMPGNVPGGDIKCLSGNYPQDPFGGGLAVYCFRGGSRKICRFNDLLLEWDRQ